MRLVAWIWNGVRIVHESLGLKREGVVLVILLLPLAFHAHVRTFLAAHGFPNWPVVDGAMPAAIVAGTYLYWRLLRHSVIREHVARPTLAVRILDPGQRYDTFVALGNRMLRLYHVEVENQSLYRTARGVTVTLVDYQKAGDSKGVDIRARLKIANSETEELDLNPGARVAFELCGIEVSGGATPVPPEPREWQTFSILPPGSGTLRLFAEARDAPAKEERYMLYVDTTGVMTIRPQAGTA